MLESTEVSGFRILNDFNLVSPLRLKLGFKFSHSSFQSLFLKISQRQIKTNEDKREINRCQFHSTNNLWVKIVLKEAVWNHSGLGMVSFNFLFLGCQFNDILGLFDVQFLQGVQSKNAEMLTLPQYSTLAFQKQYIYIYVYISHAFSSTHKAAHTSSALDHTAVLQPGLLKLIASG